MNENEVAQYGANLIDADDQFIGVLTLLKPIINFLSHNHADLMRIRSVPPYLMSGSEKSSYAIILAYRMVQAVERSSVISFSLATGGSLVLTNIELSETSLNSVNVRKLRARYKQSLDKISSVTGVTIARREFTPDALVSVWQQCLVGTIPEHLQCTVDLMLQTPALSNARISNQLEAAVVMAVGLATASIIDIIKG